MVLDKIMEKTGISKGNICPRSLDLAVSRNMITSQEKDEALEELKRESGGGIHCA